MRVTRDAQVSIFENLANHEYGARLEKLSQVLDEHPAIVELAPIQKRAFLANQARFERLKLRCVPS